MDDFINTYNCKLHELNLNDYPDLLLDCANIEYIFENTDMINKIKTNELFNVLIYILINGDYNVVSYVIKKISNNNDMKIYALKHIDNNSSIFKDSPWINDIFEYVYIIDKIFQQTNYEMCDMIKFLINIINTSYAGYWFYYSQEITMQLLSYGFVINNRELINLVYNNFNIIIHYKYFHQHFSVDALKHIDLHISYANIDNEFMNNLMCEENNVELFKYLYGKCNTFELMMPPQLQYVMFFLEENNNLKYNTYIRMAIYTYESVFEYMLNNKMLTIRDIIQDINDGMFISIKVLKMLKLKYKNIFNIINFNLLFFNSLNYLSIIKYLYKTVDINFDIVINILRKESRIISDDVLSFLYKCGVKISTFFELEYFNIIFINDIKFTHKDVKKYTLDILIAIHERINTFVNYDHLLDKMIKLCGIKKNIHELLDYINININTNIVCKYLSKEQMIDCIQLVESEVDIQMILEKYKFDVNDFRNNDYELIKNIGPIRSSELVQFLYFNIGLNQDDFRNIIRRISFFDTNMLHVIHQVIGLKAEDIRYDNDILIRNFIESGNELNINYVHDNLIISIEELYALGWNNMTIEWSGYDFDGFLCTITRDDIDKWKTQNDDTFLCGICHENNELDIKHVTFCCKNNICVLCADMSVGKMKRECPFCRSSF